MLDENAIGTRGGRLVRQEAEVIEARDPSFISLFSPKRGREKRNSVREGDNQVVALRFDAVGVQWKLRGRILGLARP
jgi:hypothetical protein